MFSNFAGMKHILILLAASLSVFLPASAAAPKKIHIVTTGDIHGAFFDEPYVGNKKRTSLMSVKWYVDSLRNAVGSDNVVLLDAGDCLQGDNATYFYNYVADSETHIYPRIAAYMGYDACVPGNHDIETGHARYDKVAAELSAFGIPWLCGNALTPDGTPYFQEYILLKKNGLKVLVIGFDNANIRAWLSPELWSGMDFKSLYPMVPNRVDILNARLRPDITVAVVHSGTGEGDGKQLENQGLDIFNGMTGVDVLVCAHDHRQTVIKGDNTCLLNCGSRAGYVGHAVVEVEGRRNKKIACAEIVRPDKSKIDSGMKELFKSEFEAVKAFTLREVGDFSMPLRTSDAYTGMCDYLNLLHTVQLSVPEADISFAAPLTYNGKVEAGTVVFNDMFTIYPYENQLFVVRMKGSEILSALEFSYSRWVKGDPDHILCISRKPDSRTDSEKWSFDFRPYNFDSAGGLVYTVDITEPAGQRVRIKSLADGRAFDPDGFYNVAMTSYRANGGGDIMPLGAGIGSDQIEQRIVARYPEIRELIYRFISASHTVTPEKVGDRTLIGEWHFEPESVVGPLLTADMNLLF